MLRNALAAFAASALLMAPTLAAAFKADFTDGTRAAKFQGRIVQTPKGPGWQSDTAEAGKADFDSVEYTLKASDLPLGGGEFNISIQRNRDGGPEYDGGSTYNTIFAFLDTDGKRLLVCYVLWNFRGNHADSGLLVWTPDMQLGQSPWGNWIPFGGKVNIGEWVDLSFQWGSAGNRILVNGVEPAAYFTEWDGIADQPKNPSKKDGTLTRRLAGAGTLVIGSDVYTGDGQKRGDFGSYNTVIASFEIRSSGAISPVRISDDTFQIPGISGKLVAGDKVNVQLVAAPGGKASFEMGKVKGIPMEEAAPRETAPGITAVASGTYQGSYVIKPGDDFENGQIVGNFVSADNVAAEPVASASKWTIDTKPVVTFNIDKKDLPADSSTKARIKLVAKDANGNPVKGRHLKLTLGTTDEYTGTVGAGDFGKDVGATVETRWRGETDSWGEVEFDYTAGFAAKTVILSAKDLDSGGVSVEYLTAYKEASIDIALTPPVNRAAARRGLMYVLKVEASRTELTADGRSRSVIRATLLDPGGKAVAGDPVAFSLSSPNGTVRTINGTTDGSGTATAEYTAGKKIGIVVVTATATLRNASDSVSITLLSDAPAKIYLKARPESLPADGFSRADLSVKVTDINDNPNADTKVEFRVAKGGGKLDSPVRVTDRFGDAADRYTSGTTPGVATILATVRSKVPSESELAKGKNVLFAPYSADSDEIRVEKWLKRKGEGFVKGDPLVEYTLSRGRTVYTLSAPYDGTMGQQFVEYWDQAEVGQTLAVLHPAPGGR